MVEINCQLEAKNIILTQGRINIIDATPIEAAQSGSGKDGHPKRDPDGGWHVKKDSRDNMNSTYGYSVHTGVDENGFIQHQTRDKLERLDIVNQVQRKGYHNKPLSANADTTMKLPLFVLVVSGLLSLIKVAMV